MLYILIPCVLLLVIAIFLKMRENANSETANDKGKKTPSKKTNKSTSPRVSRSTSTEPYPTPPPVATESQSTQLDSDVRSSIENLIKAQNYFAAEAKINQALNQDQSQHELYLYLLEIHVAQKDDFAIKQLINYLRSLGLHEIADQAESKQQHSPTAASSAAVQQSTSAFKSAGATSVALDRDLKSDAAFDELMSAPTPSKTSFDSLQSNLGVPSADQTDHQPLEYSFEKTPAFEKTPVAEPVQPLDFNLAQPETLSESNARSIEALDKQNDLAFKEQNEALEFNLTPTTPIIEKREPAPPVEDFVFNDDSIQSDKTAQPVNEFKLDSELPLQPAATDFHFSLDTPLSADPHSIAFDTQKIELSKPSASPSLDSTDVSHRDDPLAQSFPELLNVNEIQLNLDLASRYIELGAYDSAKKILAADQGQFSVEQRERSQKLLNQIAF